jgi:Bacteriophage head to tail connecting protein
MDREEAATSSAAADSRRRALRAREARAWTKRDEWQKILLDAYDYVAPHRLSTRWAKKTPQARANKIFDNTAATAWMRSAGRLQQDLFPPGEPFFVLEPGPAAKLLGMNVDEARLELQSISNQIYPVFLNGEWDQAVIEMILDMLISTGYTAVLKGDVNQPVRFANIPLDEMASDSGPYGRLEGHFWKKKWTRRAITEAFPDGNYKPEFLTENNGEEEIMFCQSVVYDPPRKNWFFFAHVDGEDDHDIWTETSRECPFIPARYFRLPGEDMGYGPVLLNLPTTKTLNKAVELTLKSSAIAMAGIYTRIDDGVFNPDTARIEPGAFWPVARNGGPLGPSIQRLPGASDPNLSNLVLQDLRLMTQAGYNDQQLPPDGQSPRSAAEIIERVKRLGQDHAGAYGRLVHDVIMGVVPRVIEILYELGVLKTQLKIDQLLVQLRVVSPLGSSFKAERAARYAEWVQACEALGGPGAARMVTPLEQGMAQMGHDMGVEADRILTVDQQTSIQNSIKAGVQAALAQHAELMKQATASPNGDPAAAQ